jgi:hypothetical protein
MDTRKLVRIYQYSDPHRGLGDIGTFAYKLMEEDCFEDQIEYKFDGSPYTIVVLTEKGGIQLDQIEGYSYYGMGWEIVSQEFYENEVKELKEKLSRMLLK